MDELKEKKLDIIKGKIKELTEEEQQQVVQPMNTKKKMAKAKAVDANREKEKEIRRKKGMLVQLMYYIRKQHFNSNQEK